MPPDEVERSRAGGPACSMSGNRRKSSSNITRISGRAFVYALVEFPTFHDWLAARWDTLPEWFREWYERWHEALNLPLLRPAVQ